MESENTSNKSEGEARKGVGEVSITITQENANNVTMELDALISDLDEHVAQQAAAAAAENDGQNEGQQTETRGENPPRPTSRKVSPSEKVIKEGLASLYFSTRSRKVHRKVPKLAA